MKILYVSSVCSERLLDILYRTSTIKPMYSIQKFHRLVLRGFVANHAAVQTLSAIPVSFRNHKKKFWNVASEVEDGVVYKYVPFFNAPVIRQVWIFIFSFFCVLWWGVRNKREKRLVCDVLNVSVCMGSLLASKLVGLKSVGIVTDMPGLMVTSFNKKKLGISEFVRWVNKFYLNSFDYYVFLTEQMNPKINTKGRPYIVMEGLVDVDMKNLSAKKEVGFLRNLRNIIYAGGLHEEYGVKMLLEAFLLLDMKDVTLSLYGDGPLVPFIKECENRDRRIHYYGVQPNNKIVEEELKATLLVNPRPTHEEFTQYSFPSKNMEYMVSGTPLLTTRLPGMPQEYDSHVYLFDEESVEGYHRVLKEVLSLPEEKLRDCGSEARKWVLKNKNNELQTYRIFELINKK